MVPRRVSALAGIRAATAANHETVDATFGRFDLGRDEDYGRFLLAHARALPAVEAALRTLPGLPPLRPRTPLLHADLATLGLAVPTPIAIDPPQDRASGFGMAYVMEGSRLGGGMLARGVPAHLPRTYLTATHVAGEWRAFGQALDAAAEDAAWLDRAIVSARRVFDLYAEAANGA